MYHDDGGAYIGRTSSHAKLFFHVMAGSTVRDKMPDIYIPSRDVESHLDPSSVDDENAFYELLIRALSSKITEINAKQQACESDFLGYVQQALSEKIYIEQNRVFNEFDSKRMIYNSIPYPSFDINLTGTQSFHVRTSPEVYKDLDDHKKKELNKACEGIKMIAVLGESAKEAGASLRDMRERIATNNGYRSSEYIVADKKRLRFEQVPNTYTGATNTAAVSDYFLTYLVDTLLLNGTTVGDILSILSTNSAADKSNPVISHTEEMFNEENARNAVNASFCPSNELTSEHRATYVAVGQMAVNAPNSYVPIFQPNERPCIAAASADQIILFYNIHAPTARTVSPCAIVANEDATNRKNEMFIMSSSMDDEEAIRLIIGELFQYLPEKRVSLDIFRTMTTPDFWKNTYVDAMAAIRDKWLDIAATSILFQIQQRQEHIHDSMLRGAAIRNSLQYARYNNHRIENGSDVRINLLLPIRQADVIGAFDGRESIMIGMSTPMNSLVDINSGAVEYDDEDNNVGMLIEEVGDWQLQNPTLFTMYTSPYNDEYCNSLTEEIFNDMQCLKEHGAKMKEPMPTFLPHPPFQSTSRTATGSDFDDVLTKLSLKQKLARGEQISGVEPSTMKFVQDLWGNDDYRRHIKDSSSSDDEVTTVLEEENNDPSLNLCRRISQEPLSSEKAECYDGAIATRVRVFVNDLDYMQDVNQELLELKDKFATVFISTTL
uniref:ORF81 n=1 Tax=Malaco herpesvirus 4 TaxID=3031800 RepID=A0AA48P8B3_9VIRU|nr:TPA_asm: ORF81 [Malaco herpesvirus 4]